MKKFILSMGFACLLLGSFTARATLVRAMNIRELTSDASLIIKATVTAKDTALDAEESGHIVTYYTLKVKDWLKGTPTDDNELVFKQIAEGEYTLNGQRIRQKLFFPQYEVGKTYVFFLPEAHERTGLLAPLGLQQGVFDVIRQNGRDILPQLKDRAKLLQKGLDGKQNKFLRFQVNSVEQDPSYQNFKAILEAAGQK